MPTGGGCFLRITRRAGETNRHAASFVGRVGIIPGVGGRDPAAEERLTAARARADFTAIRSLRRAPEEPDHTCLARPARAGGYGPPPRPRRAGAALCRALIARVIPAEPRRSAAARCGRSAAECRAASAPAS